MKTRTWSWGTSITLVYIAFAAGTLAFVVFAMTQSVDLVSADYYEQALRHDSTQKARQLAIDDSCSIRKSSDGLLVMLGGVASSISAIHVTWYRAQSPSMDKSQTIATNGNDSVYVPTKGLTPGEWNVTITWSVNGRERILESPVRVDA